jgi:cell fate regulator YaaT (PSP1 superfamily)
MNKETQSTAQEKEELKSMLLTHFGIESEEQRELIVNDLLNKERGLLNNGKSEIPQLYRPLTSSMEKQSPSDAQKQSPSDAQNCKRNYKNRFKNHNLDMFKLNTSRKIKFQTSHGKATSLS